MEQTQQQIQQQATTKQCPFCGEEINEVAIKCKHCGEMLENKGGKSWVISYCLAGIPYCALFGTHNFYNGKYKIAIAQLILTLTVYGAIISFVWVIVDCFKIAFNRYKDNKGSKLSKKITIKSTALLSLIGAHRFYVEKEVSGLFFLFSLGGLGIWWLIDFITILSGNFKDGNGNYITE